MRIGLLQCDHITPKYLPTSGNYPEMYARIFPELTFEIYDLTQHQYPSSPHDCDVWMVTGSKLSVYDQVDWIIWLKAFVGKIQAADKYYLGICFGHQMLAEGLGGKVEKAPVGWCVGIHTFEVREQAKWMRPFQAKFRLIMCCQDQVQVLPENSQVLASTADCPVGCFQVGTKMMGVQAHPEFTKALIKALIEDRVERIGPGKAQKGIDSLDQNTDSDLMAQWMLNFFK